MKPGYLTTEFWLTIVVGVLTNLGTIEVPDKFKWIVNGGLVVGYAISRGLAKYDTPSFPVIPNEAVDPTALEVADQKAATAAAKRSARK
jgi:hypothetical protein